MQSEKISISLPSSLLQFIENYKSEAGYKSRSAVIESAVKLLQEQYLESAYARANLEIDPQWETTTHDGLTDDSTW
ncbi:MAG: type II toxin-antitoxin system ParD family antitoxin [Prochloraceae cyanobacterium]